MFQRKKRADGPAGLTREHVIWAYRLLLDREPESEDVIGPKLAGSCDTSELRRHLMTSAEFQAKNRDYAHTNDSAVVIAELEPGLRLFVDLADHVIGLNIVRGRYEQDEVRLMRRVVSPGHAAIDVGAHIGYFTMQLAALVGPTGAVYAFEPLDPNADLLERSIAENRFGDRVIFRRAAVGRASGAATLTFPAETLNTGGAYLLPAATPPLTGNRTAPIELVALDDLAQCGHRGQTLRRPVRFIKMDVEGAEPQVVAGARRLLAEDRPIILSELHPTQLARASGASPGDFLDQMKGLGYTAHRLTDGDVGPPLDGAEAGVTSIVLVHDSRELMV